ncbi:MAG: polysaccharide deacetylase family protein [Gemmatimonadales bacterium]|nr:polysaccharide deacetylase family protein [Gemmatimonadales bacterium]
MRQTTRWLAQRFGRQAVILVYHRVAELRSDPWSLAVTTDHFAQHLEVLRRRVRPMGLGPLVNALRDGDLPRGAAAVTFDDGYADNLHRAKPLLERYEVPATVFVTTGAIGAGREFWWDELDRVFLQPGVLARELCVTIDGRTHAWNLGEAANYSEDSARGHRSWRAQEPAPTPRHEVYQSLCSRLRTLAADDQQQVLRQLQVWTGVEPACRPSHRTLSGDEVVTLAQGGLLDVGAHTVTHPALAHLPAASQRQEIEQSKADLEMLLGRPVTSFAYPFGGRSDYTGATVSMVRAAGFTSACSTSGGTVRPSTAPYRLPRLYVPDCDGEQFAHLLSRWLPA